MAKGLTRMAIDWAENAEWPPLQGQTLSQIGDLAAVELVEFNVLF
jgi:hypothetical protein